MTKFAMLDEVGKVTRAPQEVKGFDFVTFGLNFKDLKFGGDCGYSVQ